MAIATRSDDGLLIDGETVEPASGDRVAARIQSGFGRELSLEALDLYLETEGVVVVSTSPKPFNPFGL